MNVSHFLFSAEQLNRLFPYYILISKELKIDAGGAAYAKTITFSAKDSFTKVFSIPGTPDVTYNELMKLTGTPVTIAPLNYPNVQMEGQMEYLSTTDQFLFTGNVIKSTDKPYQPVSNKNKNNFYEEVLNEVPADIVVFDTEHRYQFINKAAIKDEVLRKRMIGLKDEDFCWLTRRPESLAQERRARFNEVMATKQIKTWEEKLTAPDGTINYHLRNLYPVLDANNNVKLLIGYGLNITDRKKVEEQLKLNEKKYRDLYNFSPALIYTHNIHGNIDSINPAISDTLGYNERDVIGSNIKKLLPVYDHDKVQRQYIDKLKAEGAARGICRALHKNGKDIVYLFYQSYVAGADTDSPYIIGFSHDITDRINIEKELRAAKITTESAARAKEVFLANMSHEIRTPMNGILGLNNLLAKTDLTDQQRDYTKLIGESVNNLLTIVNDILDIEKIASRKLELESKPFNISNKLNRTLQTFQYKSKEKNLSLKLNNRLPEEFIVIGDEHRFAQIVTNLISNSIKFTRKGSITVSASLLYNANDKVLLEFSVADTGIGIPPDRLPVIFDPFVQASSLTTRRFGGTGLGLSICKSLVEMQGGHIKVNSKPNIGTEFIFSLTYKKGQAYGQRFNDEETLVDTDKLRDKTVLVAEDVELNQFLVRNLLESWGCVVDVVDNGVKAVEKVKTNDYDVVLMDIQMPEMDGITATRQIRQLPVSQHNDVPIIAFTANALQGDSRSYFDAGMNDCIIKPYTEEKLFEKLVDVINKDKSNKNAATGINTPMPAAENVKTELPPMEEVTGKLYDLTMIETISKNNQDFVNKMIKMFADVTTQDVNNLKTAAGEGNWETVSQIAHKLKSTVGNMGVEVMKQPLRELELRTSDQPEALVASLDEKLEKVIAQLKHDHPGAFYA